MDHPHTTETQVTGELDRRLAEEAAAIEAAAEMTAKEMKEAGLDEGPVADLKEAAKEATGRRRPKPAEVVEVAEEQLSEEERRALEAAIETKPKED